MSTIPTKVTGISYKVDDNTSKYVMKKIDRLCRYLPRHAKKTVSAEVKLSEVNYDHGNKYEAEIIVNVPGKVLTAKDATVNMFAAIDIVDAKLKVQLRDYKNMSVAHIGRRGLMSRFKKSFNRELNN